MITLYADTDCAACRRLADKLKGVHLAHRVKHVDDDHAAHTLDDNGETVTGHQQIDERIDETWDLVQKSQRYQGDYCMQYPDEDEKDRKC